jgi:hypothetical protein
MQVLSLSYLLLLWYVCDYEQQTRVLDACGVAGAAVQM